SDPFESSRSKFSLCGLSSSDFASLSFAFSPCGLFCSVWTTPSKFLLRGLFSSVELRLLALCWLPMSDVGLPDCGSAPPEFSLCGLLSPDLAPCLTESNPCSNASLSNALTPWRVGGGCCNCLDENSGLMGGNKVVEESCGNFGDPWGSGNVSSSESPCINSGNCWSCGFPNVSLSDFELSDVSPTGGKPRCKRREVREGVGPRVTDGVSVGVAP